MRIFTTEFTVINGYTVLLWILVVALGGDVECLSHLYHPIIIH